MKTGKSQKKKRIIVAMSSGVDSSVAAAILKKQGFDVVGVFMHFWKEPNQNQLVENKCCSIEAQEDARKVCQILGIPLYTANVAAEFKKEVVDYYLHELQAGRTPNPCVACNKHIKFNVLFKKMLEMKADYVASGHYARLRREISKSKLQKPNKSQKANSKYIYKLFQGKDEEKDQSYFLYNFNQKQLAKILFPIGKYKKSEIRSMAKKLKLPIFDKDDSQGICFAPEKYPTDFVRRNLKMKKGDTVDTAGNVIGQHDGLALYTIGQRRGINIGGTGPYYVVEKNIKKNVLVVSNKENEPGLVKRSMLVGDVTWIVGGLRLPAKVKVKIRYRHPVVSATIKKAQNSKRRTKNGEDFLVEFLEPQKAVTPGQSAVFYTGKGEVLGGGIIT